MIDDNTDIRSPTVSKLFNNTFFYKVKLIREITIKLEL